MVINRHLFSKRKKVGQKTFSAGTEKVGQKNLFSKQKKAGQKTFSAGTLGKRSGKAKTTAKGGIAPKTKVII